MRVVLLKELELRQQRIWRYYDGYIRTCSISSVIYERTLKLGRPSHILAQSNQFFYKPQKD